MYIYVDISKKVNWFAGNYKFKITRIADNRKSLEIQLKEELSEKKKEKLCKKLIKKSNNGKIIFANKIYEKYQYIVDYANSNNLEIVKGKEIYESLLEKIIEYILDKNKNIKFEDIQLGICVSSFTYDRLELIKRISEKVKGLTVITNEKDKLDKVKENILENSGMSMRVGNTTKILKNCNMIINFDIDNSQILNNISTNCIYINLGDKITKTKKSFNGIIINNILIENIYLDGINIQNYSNCAIAETLEVEAKTINILKLIGMKNEISEQEIARISLITRKK